MTAASSDLLATNKQARLELFSHYITIPTANVGAGMMRLINYGPCYLAICICQTHCCIMLSAQRSPKSNAQGVLSGSYSPRWRRSWCLTSTCKATCCSVAYATSWSSWLENMYTIPCWLATCSHNQTILPLFANCVGLLVPCACIKQRSIVSLTIFIWGHPKPSCWHYALCSSACACLWNVMLYLSMSILEYIVA